MKLFELMFKILRYRVSNETRIRLIANREEFILENIYNCEYKRNPIIGKAEEHDYIEIQACESNHNNITRREEITLQKLFFELFKYKRDSLSSVVCSVARGGEIIESYDIKDVVELNEEEIGLKLERVLCST